MPKKLVVHYRSTTIYWTCRCRRVISLLNLCQRSNKLVNWIRMFLLWDNRCSVLQKCQLKLFSIVCKHSSMKINRKFSVLVYLTPSSLFTKILYFGVTMHDSFFNNKKTYSVSLCCAHACVLCCIHAVVCRLVLSEVWCDAD